MMTVSEITGNKAMTDLCQSFHVLRHAPGVDPWNQKVFAGLLHGAGRTSGSVEAARFALEVWNGGYPDDGDPWWDDQPFNVVRAFRIWDSANREAFKNWCENPFWP